MRSLLAALLLLPVALPEQARAQARPSDSAAVAVIDRAITRMGGESALRAVRTIRMDVMTQWQRVHLGSHPYADAPSYERHADLRDYEARTWRNTRAFLPAGGSVDIVRDTVAGRTLTAPNGAVSIAPLNIAYVDERRELFAFAPERTLLLARDAGGLRALPDTTIDGVAHARVTGAVDGFPAIWFLRRTDGFLALVRFRADETNDFGLAPWGMMEVETWFSNWVPAGQGLVLPRQRDVRRVGRPYKRMTALAITVNAPAPADSFAIADSTVAGYLATQRAPMWDVALDAAPLVGQDFVSLPPFTGVGGAVRVGGVWVLLETGQAGGAARNTAAFLARSGTGVGAGIVTMPTPGNGGVTWFAEQRLPLLVAPGAAPIVRQILGDAATRARATTITGSRWVRVGTDSLWLERLELPDAPGALAVYSPTHRWLYSGLLVGRPMLRSELDALIARLRARGLPVEWVGNPRAIRAPVTP